MKELKNNDIYKDGVYQNKWHKCSFPDKDYCIKIIEIAYDKKVGKIIKIQDKYETIKYWTLEQFKDSWYKSRKRKL